MACLPAVYMLHGQLSIICTYVQDTTGGLLSVGKAVCDHTRLTAL